MDPATIEEAVELFFAQRRAGASIDPRAFAAAHPGLEPDLSSALESLLALERATVPDGALDTPIPDRIGAYRVVREIGRGGMGVVFEAVEEPLGRRVALKVLPPELLASASARARFRREAELAARLDHSGIATIYGAGVEAQHPWIAMRYVEGKTLAQAISESRQVGSSCLRLAASSTREREASLRVAELLAKVAHALHAAHEQGVVHRDIKPSNVIVQPDGTPILVDFGLAITEEADGHTLTRTGEAPGTPAYLAPEIVGGEIARPDAQSDVYALGVTLYECLALRRPFDAPTPAALFRSILDGAPQRLRALSPSTPGDLAVVVATAMERDRDRRYRNARALAEDLEACVVGRPIAARPVPIHGRLLRWARREPRQASLAGGLLAAAFALALFAGNFWASRDVVHAAEEVARDQELERTLTEGFFVLQQNHPSSQAVFDRALALDPGNLEAKAGKILSRMGLEQKDAALDLLRDAPATLGFDALRARCRGEPVRQDVSALESPASTALDFLLVSAALMHEGEHSALSETPRVHARALAMANEAIVRSPRARAFMHVERAIAAFHAKDVRAARSASRTLVALWPDSYHAMYAAGLALTEIEPREAIAILEKAARLKPDDAAPLLEIGNSWTALGEFDMSELWIRRALLRTKAAPIYDSLCAATANRACWDEAAGACASAIALDPLDAQAWTNLGATGVEANDPRQSVFPLERAIELDPTNPVAYGYLGAALLALGDPARARVHLETALALDLSPPEFEAQVYAQLVKDLRMLGEDDAAALVLSTGLELAPGFPPLVELEAPGGTGK